MPLDWIPRNDNAFGRLAKQLSGRLTEDPVEYGVTVPQADDLATATANWEAAHTAEKAARTAAAAAVRARNLARAALEPLMRAAAGGIQANPAVTNANRELAGLRVHKKTRTAPAAPDSAPLFSITAGRKLEHTVAWRNAGGTKARPKGVAGLVLYVKVGGAAPIGLGECRSLGMIPRAPYHALFAPAEAGLTAYYVGHWVNTRGVAGPLSEVAAATIAALV